MKDHPEPPPGSEDDLRAENEVLKLKLGVDHGMQGFGSMLNPKMENEWLKSITDFEIRLKQSKGQTMWEMIGRPQITPWHELRPENIPVELRRLLALMEKNRITLQNHDDLDDMAFYRLITEEFLPMKFGEFGNSRFMPPIIAWFGGDGR